MTNEEDCPICLAPMDESLCEECPMCKTVVDGSITTVDCCKKQFHTRCLTQCTTIKSECPLCRAKDCIIQIPVDETPEEYTNRVNMISSTILHVCSFTIIGFITLKYLLHW